MNIKLLNFRNQLKMISHSFEDAFREETGTGKRAFCTKVGIDYQPSPVEKRFAIFLCNHLLEEVLMSNGLARPEFTSPDNIVARNNIADNSNNLINHIYHALKMLPRNFEKVCQESCSRRRRLTELKYARILEDFTEYYLFAIFDYLKAAEDKEQSSVSMLISNYQEWRAKL